MPVLGKRRLPAYYLEQSWSLFFLLWNYSPYTVFVSFEAPHSNGTTLDKRPAEEGVIYSRLIMCIHGTKIQGRFFIRTCLLTCVLIAPHSATDRLLILASHHLITLSRSQCSSCRKAPTDSPDSTSFLLFRAVWSDLLNRNCFAALLSATWLVVWFIIQFDWSIYSVVGWSASWPIRKWFARHRAQSHIRRKDLKKIRWLWSTIYI